MSAPITITVARDDGEVTRLEGESGLAVCTRDLASFESPTVSLRCATEEELAWNLAAVMASVRHVAPQAFVMALRLADAFDAEHPHAEWTLPQWRRS